MNALQRNLEKQSLLRQVTVSLYPNAARADTRIIPPVLEQYLPTENTITISTSVFSDGICNYLSTIAKRGTHKHE